MLESRNLFRHLAPVRLPYLLSQEKLHRVKFGNDLSVYFTKIQLDNYFSLIVDRNTGTDAAYSTIVNWSIGFVENWLLCKNRFCLNLLYNRNSIQME